MTLWLYGYRLLQHATLRTPMTHHRLRVMPLDREMVIDEVDGDVRCPGGAIRRARDTGEVRPRLLITFSAGVGR